MYEYLFGSEPNEQVFMWIIIVVVILGIIAIIFEDIYLSTKK